MQDKNGMMALRSHCGQARGKGAENHSGQLKETGIKWAEDREPGRRERDGCVQCGEGEQGRVGETGAPTKRLSGGQKPQPSQRGTLNRGTCHSNNRILGTQGDKDRHSSSCSSQELSATQESRRRNMQVVKGFKLGTNTSSTGCLFSRLR